MSDFHKERAMKALEAIKAGGADALILFPGADIGYFTGFSIGLSERLAAALIPYEGEPALVVNELEEELRGQKPWITEVETWQEHEDPVQLLAETLEQKELDKTVIGFAEDAPWGWVNRLKQMVPDAYFVDATKYLSEIRMVKTPRELDWMRMACAITDRSLEVGFSRLKAGMTEIDLANIIGSEMQIQGGSIAFCGVLFGERAALPHGHPSERKLKSGDCILVDAGATIHGYHSDITRTVFFGEPSKSQKEVYEIVLKANQTAYDACKPGVTCESLDEIARKVIEEVGFGKYFIHRLGHGVGLQVHERPYIVKDNELVLEPSMTFTIEPGVYIVGKLGIRVEDTVVCTPEGCEYLTRHKRELTFYPIKS